MLLPEIPWHLVIAGNGPLLTSLKKRCKENNITDKVTFMTNATDDQLAKEYSTASIFVLPSIEKCGTEGFGMVLLEAMAFYIPIIAAKTGGIPEVLDNGECGILVQAKSSIALRDAITKLHANPSLRHALAARAHERLVMHYVWK
jgi:glycosyltransferase involved in cell wall biosynthesis